jgi:hypothetical protein
MALFNAVFFLRSIGLGKNSGYYRIVVKKLILKKSYKLGVVHILRNTREEGVSDLLRSLLIILEFVGFCVTKGRGSKICDTYYMDVPSYL